MSRPGLFLAGAQAVWHGTARRGRLVLPGAPVREVLVILGPSGSESAALERARAAADPILSGCHAGLLPLIGVFRAKGRVAWVYDYVDGLGLGHTVSGEPGPLLSTRAAAEVVARVAEILMETGSTGLWHPGPQPSDLLVVSTGRLWLAGFVGPYPPSPSMRAPGGDDGEAAQVYRLGALLAHLVSGVPPGPASDRAGHRAMVRSVMIRAMSRPEPVLTDRFGDWMRGMLAWDPAERPALSTVAAGLRAAGHETGGVGLVDWAEAEVRRLAREVEQAGARVRGPATVPVPPRRLDAVRMRRASTSQGQLPVRVGPPSALAARPVPRLPREWLRAASATPAGPEPVAVAAFSLAWVVTMLLLGLVASALIVYLLVDPHGERPRDPSPAAPSIGDVL